MKKELPITEKLFDMQDSIKVYYYIILKGDSFVRTENICVRRFI